MRIKKLLIVVVAVALISMGLLAGRTLKKLGNPDSPSAPANTYSYTLEDIYNRLNDGTEGDTTTFTEPTAGPGTPTMHTLNEIMAKAPAKDDANGADTGDVLTGKTFWGLNTVSGQWGLQTGTMPNNGADTITPGTSNQAIAAGYHNGSGYVEGDTDLVAGNIKDGVNIFGVIGSHACITCTGTVVGTRWCDNENGTVTDMTTGLVWLKKADWGGTKPWRRLTDMVACAHDSGYICYDDAHARAGRLKAGASGADLSDGSGSGEWRLPTKDELYALTHGTEAVRDTSPRAFTGVQAFNGVDGDGFYWSSNTHDGTGGSIAMAWCVDMTYGIADYRHKNNHYYVWPVRGP